MALLGLFVVQSFPTQALQCGIGAFVLVVTWRPNWIFLGMRPQDIDPRKRLLALGGAVGFRNMTIGATGPLIAPFYLNLGLHRQVLAGTKAASQTMGHLIKVLVFGAVGFAFKDYLAPLALIAVCVTVETWAGTRLLDQVSESAFNFIYRLVITAIGIRRGTAFTTSRIESRFVSLHHRA